MESRNQSEISRQTAQTAYSTRATQVLDQVRQSTSPTTNREFLQTLREFKRKQIDADQVKQRVSILLSDYPEILLHFEQVLLPRHKQSQFTTALSFVEKVQAAYTSDPEIYTEFIALLRDFQLGIRSRQQVGDKIAILLCKTPDLVREFDVFQEQKMGGMASVRSSETLNEVCIPVREDETTALMSEESALLSDEISVVGQNIVTGGISGWTYISIIAMNISVTVTILAIYYSLVNFGFI